MPSELGAYVPVSGVSRIARPVKTGFGESRTRRGGARLVPEGRPGPTMALRPRRAATRGLALMLGSLDLVSLLALGQLRDVRGSVLRGGVALYMILGRLGALISLLFHLHLTLRFCGERLYARDSIGKEGGKMLCSADLPELRLCHHTTPRRTVIERNMQR